MFSLAQLKTPGEHAFFFETTEGKMEAILSSPKVLKLDYVALLGHPHSLHGGSMQNKVVTTLARAFNEEGIPVIRFNFRGVGSSSGSFDGGIGESEDLLQLIKATETLVPNVALILAGFSFGSYVTYRVAAQMNTALLLSVAPPMTHFNFKEFLFVPKNWQIIQGRQDEVIEESEVSSFAASFSPPLPYHLMETTHFFHGKLLELKEEVVNIIRTLRTSDA